MLHYSSAAPGTGVIECDNCGHREVISKYRAKRGFEFSYSEPYGWTVHVVKGKDGVSRGRHLCPECSLDK